MCGDMIHCVLSYCSSQSFGSCYIRFCITCFLRLDEVICFVGAFFFQENIGVFVDQNGKLLPEGRICWSEAPLEVVIQKPYAIALLPRFVEVTDCLK